MDKFLINYGVSFAINITPNAENPTWATVGNGINNFDETINEVTQELNFLSDKGFGHTEVTGLHPSFDFSGNRILNDEAQNYIAGLKFKLGCDRKTQLNVSVKYECGNELIKTYQADVTISNIHELGGDSNGGSDFSFTLSFNGKPRELVAKPAIKAIGSGTSSVQFELACETAGASLFYSTDGAKPETAYTGIVTLSTAGEYTIKAIAKKDNFADSEIASETVSVVSAVATAKKTISKEEIRL